MVSFMKSFGLPRFMPKAFGSNFSSEYELVKVPSRRYVAFVAANDAEIAAARAEDREPVLAEMPEGMYKFDTIRQLRQS